MYLYLWAPLSIHKHERFISSEYFSLPLSFSHSHSLFLPTSHGILFTRTRSTTSRQPTSAAVTYLLNVVFSNFKIEYDYFFLLRRNERSKWAWARAELEKQTGDRMCSPLLSPLYIWDIIIIIIIISHSDCLRTSSSSCTRIFASTTFVFVCIVCRRRAVEHISRKRSPYYALCYRNV